jgi:hypothetical protein
MILPKTCEEVRVVILHHLEKNPYLKAGTPAEVVKNLKAAAVSHYKTSQMHLDLSDVGDLKGMLMISTDTYSESAASRTSRFGSEDEIDLEDQRMQLKKPEPEMSMMERLLAMMNTIDGRLKKLEEDDK